MTHQPRNIGKNLFDCPRLQTVIDGDQFGKCLQHLPMQSLHRVRLMLRDAANHRGHLLCWHLPAGGVAASQQRQQCQIKLRA